MMTSLHPIQPKPHAKGTAASTARNGMMMNASSAHCSHAALVSPPMVPSSALFSCRCASVCSSTCTSTEVGGGVTVDLPAVVGQPHRLLVWLRNRNLRNRRSQVDAWRAVLADRIDTVPNARETNPEFGLA